MDPDALINEYLKLGLRFGRASSGFVDSYTGDPELRRSVGEEAEPDPAELARSAGRLRARLPETELPEQRRRFLDAQLTALECSGHRLAGEQVAFRSEIRACFQTDIGMGRQDAYRGAHTALAELLPGRGSLTERVAAVRDRDRIRPQDLQRCVRAFSTALREASLNKVGLPTRESVDYRIVSGKPWSGLHCYLGDCRSRVLLNTDAGHRMANLPHLIAHEAYPGHHTQHCHRHGAEQDIFLLNTPQCLIAEGLADLGVEALIGPGWGEWAAEIFAGLGMRMDGELAERMHAITDALRPVRQDAALMLHEQQRDPEEVTAYLRRWLLIPRSRAEQLLRFLAHPLWRAYTTTYVEGYRLLSTWLHSGSESAASGAGIERYLRLLDEPVVPRTLRAEVSGTIRA